MKNVNDIKRSSDLLILHLKFADLQPKNNRADWIIII
jgi:hypothetical protein